VAMGDICTKLQYDTPLHASEGLVRLVDALALRFSEAVTELQTKYLMMENQT